MQDQGQQNSPVSVGREGLNAFTNHHPGVPQMTAAEALTFVRSGEWKKLSPQMLIGFQIQQRYFVADPNVIHPNLELVLKRKVSPREFLDHRKEIRAEVEAVVGVITPQDVLDHLTLQQTDLAPKKTTGPRL